MVGDRQLALERFVRLVGDAGRRIIVEAPAQRGHRVVDAQQVLGRRRAQRHDDLRPDDANLPHQERRAGFALVALGRAVARRAALHDVGDVHLLALQSHGGDHVVEQLAGAPDERQPLLVFVSARAFADEHQLGMWIASAEDDLLAPQLRQLATLAVGTDVVGDDLQKRGAILGRGSRRFDRLNCNDNVGIIGWHRVSALRNFAAIERTDAQFAIEVEALAQCGFGVGIESHVMEVDGAILRHG